MGVRVVTDSACDLPDDLIERDGIEVVPLTIRFGKEELVDRKELSTDEFWRRLAESDVLPETSAPSAGAFEAAFRRLIGDGATGIVCINLSSKLSATMQSAQVAAQAVQAECPVVVVDSLMVSMGLGTLCLTAARRAADGDSLESIVSNVTDRRNRSKLYGTLDTLEFLKKGGRVGNARALLGSMLAIKPVLEVRDGEVEEAGKVRTRSKALRLLVDRVKEGPFENLAVLHGNAPDLDELLDLLEPLAPREEILIGQIGPVIGTHAGPRVIGVTFQART
ncbi:MAG TPA: DegV family protein [Acidimicrobiia bacterium]|jgi:DegV family protein with EDD domain|nr:DegV family protein [Acidimicrobiia bacterium]